VKNKAGVGLDFRLNDVTNTRSINRCTTVYFNYCAIK